MSTDQLSYEIFNKGKVTKKEDLKEINSSNRMIVETNNYFVIVGYGAFLKGYFLIITKKTLSSFGHINKKHFNELKYLCNFLTSYIKQAYKTDVAKFEHGMCSCAGGLDHAHLHLMPFPKKITKTLLLNNFNKILKKRAIGVKEIEFNSNKFTSPHDISSIMFYENSYRLTKGNLLTYEEINIFKRYKNYPLSLNQLVKKNKQYIYLDCEINKFNFLTTQHLGTQFGREFVFECYYNSDIKFKNYIDELHRSNLDKLPWRWQDFYFLENIKNTIYDFIKFYKKNKIKNKKYNLKVLLEAS